MSEDLAQRRLRKGTKSCTECRRRKVRCTWSFDDAKSCRRCEERGSECIAQTFSAPAESRRLTSREKILQLESKVASLSKTVRNIELKLGSQPTQIPDSPIVQLPSVSEADDFEEDSSSSDVLGEDRPTLLGSLFQNEWLSVDTRRQNEQLTERRSKASAQLLDTARQSLQRLVPSREDVVTIATHGFASKWLVLLHTLFPQPFIVKSQQDMLASYDNMRQPDVDAMLLAAWLLALALTAAQVPQEQGSPGAQLAGSQRASNFARSVAMVVEKMILSHERLIGTIQGLGLALLCGRLQIFQGNFQKGWLQLRRAIAIAELLGLPQIFQAVQIHAANGGYDDESKLQKAQLWESICALDRISGTILNLPTGTKRYQHVKAEPLVIDGVVQPRAYLYKLANIAVKTRYVDDMNTPQSCSAELYSSVLDLDRELRNLTSQVPKSWWAEDVHVEARHIIAFWQQYVTMRVHLPFALHRDPGEEYLYSRISGIDACRSVVKRYQHLRRTLPSTFFLGRFLDLQVFTATVVLLLALHSTPSPSRLNMQADKAEIESLVAQIIELMDEKSHDVGANFARHGVVTIRSLIKLLRQDENTANPEELTLKVPLLGQLHVRRNVRIEKERQVQIMRASEIPPEPGSWKSNNTVPQANPLALAASTNPASQVQQGLPNLPWDPFSWSIENNHDDIFQDALMGDNFDDLGMFEVDMGGFIT
ncbi:putative C6 finger domain protein [Rhizodiscina lignyota]|uniref:C6 finger domain protein n=1 Tax=Rhizodiscina lignyota TaxID=1504668 RepID=A0A9P4I9Z0_9PEZI|nr:putative C6 finger domain protein [Rhizodiscina lignyota]